jgi:hypothetical protein
MEIVGLNFQRSPKQISRVDFCEQLRRVLAEKFPDEAVDCWRSRAFSLAHVRTGSITRKGGIRGAFLAVPEGESQDAIGKPPGLRAFVAGANEALGRQGTGVFSRLILPEGEARWLAHQLGSLDPDWRYRFTN